MPASAHIAAVSARLCREWPAAAGCFVKALLNLWEGLSDADAPRTADWGPVVDFIAELAWRNALRPACVVAPLRLWHETTTPQQGKLLCALILRMQGVLGCAALREDLFSADYLQPGIFPSDGTPANIRFVDGLFREAGLAWMCEHESFHKLAMLSSDSEPG